MLAAYRDVASVSVNPANFARHRGTSNLISKCEGCILAAVPQLPAGQPTTLSAFDGVNGLKSDPLAMNIDCIAINDRSRATYGLRLQRPTESRRNYQAESKSQWQWTRPTLLSM